MTRAEMGMILFLRLLAVYGRELKPIPMFTHADVWRGIDRLAAHHGLTASGLARRAGLDPTAFNPSKRITKQHKARWPSTESLAKVLDATQTPFASFVALMAEQPVEGVQLTAQRIRCLAFDQLEREGLFDEAGFPIGDQWDEIEFPSVDDRHAYALEVRGDRMAPLYRDGDLLIASPAASIRRRDRVLLKLRAGPMQAGELQRRSARGIGLRPFAEGEERNYSMDEVAWLARIVWASQ